MHGLASNARLWDGVAEILAGRGHRVIAVDQRGHGLSDKPGSGYDFGTLTDDLVALLDACDVDACVAVGQSWGANVVLELGARHPDRVRGVACVDGGAWHLADRVPNWDEAARILAPPVLEGTPVATIEAGMRDRHPDWPEAGIQGALANFEVRDDGTVIAWLSRANHMTILRHLWEHRPLEVRERVSAPILSIPSRDYDADHDIHAQKPELVADLLLKAFAA